MISLPMCFDIIFTFFPLCFEYVPMQNVGRASSAQAVSSHVTVRVEGHVTPGLESAAGDVLQAFMEIDVSWVRRKAASIH